MLLHLCHGSEIDGCLAQLDLNISTRTHIWKIFDCNGDGPDKDLERGCMHGTAAILMTVPHVDSTGQRTGVTEGR